MEKIALVTGANRGIGLEISKQLAARNFTVILTARNMQEGRPLVNKLRKEYGYVWFHQLDVSSEQSIKDIAAYLNDNFGKLDVLINNAGILLEENHSFEGVNIQDVRDSMETNVYGPLMLTRAMIPYLEKSDDARVINLSSRMGQLRGMGWGHAAYRISKAALNALSLIMSNELAHKGITVNSMCPGWVRTDMGGEGAGKTVEEGADTAVWLATEKKIPSGKFFAERKVIDW